MANRLTAAEIKAKYAKRGNDSDDDDDERRSRNKNRNKNHEGPSWNDDSGEDNDDEEDDRRSRNKNSKKKNSRRRRDDEDEDSDEDEEDDVEEAKPAKKVVKDNKPMTTGDKNKLMMSYFTLITHTIICLLLSTASALGIQSSYATSANTVVVGLYILLFSLILLVYEIVQVGTKCCTNRLDWIDLLWKKNFGFLYGPLGRGAYVMFVGTLMFGISGSLATGAAIFCIIWGIALILISYQFKNLFEEKQKFDPSTSR